MSNELLILFAFGVLQIIICVGCYILQNKRIAVLRTDISNHHQFLLKVKNDVPQLWSRVNELENQILPPEGELH